MVNEKINPLVEQLMGREINGKWKVVEKFEKKEDDTGGAFSIGYKVMNKNGKEAFLKAFNFKRALEREDTMSELNRMTSEYNYEKEILEKCFNKKLKHIVNILDAGKITENEYVLPVPYIIFEIADESLRNKINELNEKIDIIWNLKCIHQVAVGLQEIHQNDMAHLDLKPSNILIFDKTLAKITDFGRSSMKISDNKPQYDISGIIEGDRTYSPIERLYGVNEGDWYEIKVGTDFYLLGSFIFNTFTKYGITVAIIKELDPQFDWKTWKGSYEEVYAYVIDVYSKVMRKFEKKLKQQKIDERNRKEIVKMVNEMCNPDKSKRGDPDRIKRKDSQKYDLQRYITKLDLIIKRIEIIS